MTALDLRTALRGLVKTPLFTVTAVLTLALGIGANTAIFGLVDRLLLKPLPLPEAERLVVVTEFRDPGYDNFSYPDFEDVRRESRSFTGLAGILQGSAVLGGTGEPERLRVGQVTGGFFEVVGVQPQLGRGFNAAEAALNGPSALVLGHGLWVRRFGGDPSVVGRTLRLNGQEVPVIGVMPPGFEMPYALRGSEVYMPLRLEEDRRTARGMHFLPAIGRLKPGVTLEQARAEVRGLVARMAEAMPGSNRKYQGKVVTVQEEVTGKARPVLLALQGAVGFVLLIACANVANLLLARSGARTRELAIRAALGADRRRLMTQLLVEGTVLALMGATAGLGVARLAGVGLAQVLPLRAPGPEGLDLRMLAFTLGLALLSVLVFALVPAFQASRPDLTEGLREGAKGSTGPRHRRLRQALVVGEVALATALLASAGLMLRSLWSLQRVDPGFQTQTVVTSGLTLPASRYPQPADQRAFLARLVARASELPGVTAAAAVDLVPLGGASTTSTYLVDGETPAGEPPATEHRGVTPDFFRTLGIPLLRGRTFAPGEGGVALVSAAFARRHWPDGDPLGHRISFGGSEGPWATIVGVVGDIRTEDLGREPRPQAFLPLLDPSGGPRLQANLVLQGPALGAVVPSLKALLRELDPELPLSRVQPLADLLRQEREAARARGILFAAFALVALLLSGVGIFGVTSTLVVQRTPELGVRMALGAQAKDVLLLVMGQGLAPLGIGLVGGIAGALALGRLLEGQLHGVTPLDPATYLGVLGALGLTGLLATLLPALRATRVDPLVALRGE